MSKLKKNLRPRVKPDDPWNNDSLERKKVADFLTPVVASIRQPFTIGLNAPYGHGKTYFIECWRQELRNAGFITAYFNAWETDFSSEPLISFIASLKNQLDELVDDEKRSEIGKRIRELSKRSTKFLWKSAIPILAKGAARKLTDSQTFDEISEAVSLSDDDIEDSAERFAIDLVERQAEAEKSLETFRHYLSKTIEKITTDVEGDDKKKIIVFVDELDRCRPSYAIELLENIKHLLSVDGFVFILSLDYQHLRGALNTVYGAELDADGYLRRFIDWQFRMPAPSARLFAEFLCQRFELANIKIFNDREGFYDLADLSRGFAVFAEAFGFSLRQQEQCFTEINLSMRSLNKKSIPLANVVGCLTVLRAALIEDIRDCSLNNANPEYLLENLDSIVANVDFEGFYFSWERFRPILHSWFLNDAQSANVQQELRFLMSELNDLSMQHDARNEPRRAELEIRRKYLEKVIESYRYGAQRLSITSESIAAIAFRRLELASRFTNS